MMNAYNFNVKIFTSYSVATCKTMLPTRCPIQKGMKSFQAHYSLEWNHFKPITLLNVADVASNMNHPYWVLLCIKAERGIGLAKAPSFLNTLCAPAIINFHIMPHVQEGLSRAFQESNGSFLNVPEEPHCIYISSEYDSNLFPSMLALQE